MRRVAVLLNRNAQRVTPRLVESVARFIPRDHLFVTASMDEARAALATIAERSYEVLCVGGGDGTFMQAVTGLAAAGVREWPALFSLQLGSGNAMPEVCGASKPDDAGIERDLKRAMGDEPARPLRLLCVDGHFTPTVGVGLDAKFNEDLEVMVKKRLGRGLLAPLFRGVPGIALTAALRTLPRLLREPQVALKFFATDGPAHLLGADGLPSGEAIPEGGLLYQGRAIIASASTISTYGRGVIFFPSADRIGDRFQLRIASAGALQILPRLPKVFSGHYYNPEMLWDYAVCGIRCELDPPEPYHLSGELQPRTRQFAVSRAAFAVPILRAD